METSFQRYVKYLLFVPILTLKVYASLTFCQARSAEFWLLVACMQLFVRETCILHNFAHKWNDDLLSVSPWVYAGSATNIHTKYMNTKYSLRFLKYVTINCAQIMSLNITTNLTFCVMAQNHAACSLLLNKLTVWKLRQDLYCKQWHWVAFKVKKQFQTEQTQMSSLSATYCWISNQSCHMVLIFI